MLGYLDRSTDCELGKGESAVRGKKERERGSEGDLPTETIGCRYGIKPMLSEQCEASMHISEAKKTIGRKRGINEQLNNPLPKKIAVDWVKREISLELIRTSDSPELT